MVRVLKAIMAAVPPPPLTPDLGQRLLGLLALITKEQLVTHAEAWHSWLLRTSEPLVP